MPILRSARPYFSSTSSPKIRSASASQCSQPLLWISVSGWPGPKHAILALGYAGWAPGQLETEIQSNGWLHCDADPELIFGDDVDEKYQRALQKIGIDVGMLSNEAGHA